jgi:hypothetical protein
VLGFTTGQPAATRLVLLLSSSATAAAGLAGRFATGGATGGAWAATAGDLCCSGTCRHSGLIRLAWG